MKSKRLKYIAVVTAIACVCLTGCGKKQERTPEEMEAASIAAMVQEEQATGLRRLNSSNLTELEQTFADFVYGIYGQDPELVANSLGVVNVFGDSLRSWVIHNNYERFQEYDPETIRVSSEKTGADGIVKVYFGKENAEADNYEVFDLRFVNDRWCLELHDGVKENYVFYAPTNNVKVNGVDMSAYAVADRDKSWKYTIPRMLISPEAPKCSFETDFGNYSGTIETIGTELSRDGFNMVVGQIPASQQVEIEDSFISCAKNVFTLIGQRAERNEYTPYLLDANEVEMICRLDDEKDAETISSARNVVNVEVLPAVGIAGYPESYIYHFVTKDSISMDVRCSIVTEHGECHKLATIIMAYINDGWKIKKITATGRMFTEISPFDPEW